MKLKYLKDRIIFEKELNNIDKFTIDFVSILDELNLNYVLMSGYVAILFGRNRLSEDVDIFLEELDKNRFEKLWIKLKSKFECVITDDCDDAYNEYLRNNSAIRFAKKGEFIPNMEVKFPKKSLDFWPLNNKKKVVLNGISLYISPLELQISFKLVLGSEKDIEDARFLYKLFEDKIDLDLLNEFNRKLKIEDLFIKYLK